MATLATPRHPDGPDHIKTVKRVKARLPTFAEGPGDELKDGLGKFHEAKLAAFRAAAHGGRGQAGSALDADAQKGRLPL